MIVENIIKQNVYSLHHTTKMSFIVRAYSTGVSISL